MLLHFVVVVVVVMFIVGGVGVVACLLISVLLFSYFKVAMKEAQLYSKNVAITTLVCQ